uniref:Uncharacterized protein n=1 Tax=Rhizophora mucronata TaxID=61149 RepID=A0A2P2JSI8_RHIMU
MNIINEFLQFNFHNNPTGKVPKPTDLTFSIILKNRLCN